MLDLIIEPLTPERWPDIETLFGDNGACGGCWCMWWRLTRGEFDKHKGDDNRAAFKKIVESNQIPGLLAYLHEEPVGWCAIEPRENYPGLATSRVLKPIDDLPVWSISCFFVRNDHRRQGVSLALLESAKDYVRSKGGQTVEGYPVEPRRDKMPGPFVWTGIDRAFKQAGFTEMLRRSETRPIMRHRLR